MKVLLVTTSNQRRGAESFALDLADELRRRRMTVIVRSLVDAAEASRLPIRPIGSGALSMTTLSRLRREMGRADVVVACGSRALPACAVAGLRTPIPVIYQNIGDPGFWAPAGLRRARVRACLARMAAVAALSDRAATTLTRDFGVPASRIEVVPNGRDSAYFRPPSPIERARARSALGVGMREVLVTVAGALSPEKRVELAIRAVAAMPRHVHLAVVGDGPLRTSLEQEANTVAPGRVRFLGQRRELRSVLWAADALVLTSASEGMPGVLIEAGMCGVPAMSVDVGYVRDVIVDGRTGHLVERSDITTLVSALTRTLDERDRLGPAARGHCHDRFELGAVSAQWAALIERTVKEGTRRVRV